MAPLIIEGENLGQKHRNYNKLLKEFISKDTTETIQKINYNEPDLTNLFRIDIANHKKNVEYILEVLKCEDMLYVSRALKRSVWLISDNKYAHIINPDHIHSKLLPQMTTKAGQKFLLSIRLTLKNEKRVEEFYDYYEAQKELDLAFKWLPNCSSSCIQQAVEKHIDLIPPGLIKILCEKHSSIFELCVKKRQSYDSVAFLLNSEPKKFLDIVKIHKTYDRLRLNRKSVKIIMKTCPDVIIENFDKIAYLDVAAFVRCLKQEMIMTFLKKYIQNENLQYWFTFDKLKLFIARMPVEGRFEFIKRVFIENNNSEEGTNDEDVIAFSSWCKRERNSDTSNEYIYRWYVFAPFSTAFTDLKKLIRLESSPSERNEMLKILLTCTRGDIKLIHTVLQYYRDKHINESFMFKIYFINFLFDKSYPYRFDDKTWNVLNEIFCSMDVYSESENNVQSCLKHIILYNVIHNSTVPNVVESKFEFDTLKSFQSNLNEEEKDKVFQYLYQYMITKIEKVTLTSESSLRELKNYILNVLNLLVDWKKDLRDHQFILNKIREVITAKTDKCWNEELSDIYNVNKSWRKHMFRESLALQPTQESYVNALKHDPEILKENTNLNNSMVIGQLLKKIRIYFPETLAKVFEDTFLNHLTNISKHKVSVQGLCILLPREQIIDLIKKYQPEGTNIKWGETDEVTLSIQKCFAKYMYLARPQLPVEIVLLYAKGDYLQFTLPSLLSIHSTMSINQSLERIPLILDTPVSMQKHALKFAFAKLKTEEFLKICSNMWISTKNATIRETVFKLTFDLMCKEQSATLIDEIWHVLTTFIDDLSSNENKRIYDTLSQARKVPLTVKKDYCVKSYRFYKSLPPTINCHYHIELVIEGMRNIMEYFDVEFLSEVVFDSFEESFAKSDYKRSHIISSYLLSTKSEIIQTERFERIFIPLLNKYIAFLSEAKENLTVLKSNFRQLLWYLLIDVKNIVLEKNMVTPVKLFNDIYCNLEKHFSHEENYVMIVTWKLAAEYMKVVDKHRSTIYAQEEFDEKKWIALCVTVAPDFGKTCVEHLTNETEKYFPSIYGLFAKALKYLFDSLRFSDFIQIKTVQSIQAHVNTIEGHLLVLKITPNGCYICDSDKEERSKIYEILASHPSAEVRMPYQNLLRDSNK